MRLSLKGRIALIILAGALFTVVAVLATAYHSLVDDFERLLSERQAQETVRAAEQVEQMLALRMHALESVSGQLSNGRQLDSAAKLTATIERQRNLQRFFPGGLVVMDSGGTAIAESVLVPGRLGTNYADRSHFRQMQETRKPVISHPIIGRTTGAPLISFLSPILSDEGDLLGILSGVINLANTSILPKRQIDEARRDGVIFKILDTDNLVYVYNGADLSTELQPLPPPRENPLIDAALSGFGVGVSEQGDEQRLVFASTHLQQLGWIFVRAVPYEQAIAPARAFFLRFAGISVLIGGALALVAFWLAWTAMRPLESMTRQIRMMATQARNNQPLPETGVSEVAGLARAFNRLTAERKALSEIKDDFVAVVSHELRTPLTSINGALRLMESGATGSLPDQAGQLTTLALRNGERLQVIINDLLDFNKLSTGKMVLAPVLSNVTELVDDAVSGNAPMAAAYRVQVRSQAASLLQASVDPLRLRQILDNLISNAIKFSPAGGWITVRAERVRQDRLRITVSDQGGGIPDEFKCRLFERFAQAEHGTMRASRGTGLGLTICKELVELMQGNIGYYNSDGAHVWVELPMMSPDDNGGAESQADEEANNDNAIYTQ
ncbi:sensor histidine kinase [Oceanisphaera sp. KMM 10153]|uniref:sensor histidine kinase n=1 Tax=Oceanisphaera submarina TaxID=3390193 RepID=UPI003976B3F9